MRIVDALLLKKKPPARELTRLQWAVLSWIEAEAEAQGQQSEQPQQFRMILPIVKSMMITMSDEDILFLVDKLGSLADTVNATYLEGNAATPE